MVAKKENPIHYDSLGQTINPGDYIAFSHSYTIGVILGRVISTSKKRVRIGYKHHYIDHNKQERVYEGRYQAVPNCTLVINNNLEQQLTMLKLKNRLP